MRAIRRLPLPDEAGTELERRQREFDQRRADGEWDATAAWDTARKSSALGVVRQTLREMAGKRERCMYCVDSHASDIEHFWPKAHFPERMFVWPNLLLCCTPCGRYKGDRSPENCIDPTTENPWDSLDFDSMTGNLTARWDTVANMPSPRGEATVALLHLDRREPLANGYQKTYRRLCERIADGLAQPDIAPDPFAESLFDTDDHGLLGWCLDAGADEEPFATLRTQRPDLWDACLRRLAT